VWALTELLVGTAAPSYEGLGQTTSSWGRRR